MSYQMCKRCVMDTTAKEIQFDANGHCNFCNDFFRRQANAKNRRDQQAAFIEQIKKDGKNKPYDCIVGVSGGVDSSYALHLAKEHGLRPLAAHMDNGWNTELAANNISNLVRGVGFDLYTHVIDWEEYRDLMNSFFKADVLDVELLYDNAMLAVNYNLARKYKLKYILSGVNTSTEGLAVPKSWTWLKSDKVNIKAIQKRFGSRKIKTMPMIGLIETSYNMMFGAQWLPFLDYFDYVKADVLELLKEKYQYKPYPYKHYESVFTRFYQGHILLEKFNVDKRRVHLSTLVCSGQMDRDAALEQLKDIPYPSQKDLDEDIDFFLKKMNWSRQDLDDYLSRPEVPHDAYPSQVALYEFLLKVYRFFKPQK